MFGRNSSFGTPLNIALAALVASISVNVFTFHRLGGRQSHCEPMSSIDDSKYSEFSLQPKLKCKDDASLLERLHWR